MKNNSPKYFLILLIVFFAACNSNIEQTEQEYSISGSTMGTTYSIKFIDINSDVKMLKHNIDSILVEVNRQMSTWKRDSEISNFNNYNKTDWFNISMDFARVIKKSLEICKKTNGAFDITVGPLVNIWGFGPEQKADIVPSKELISSTLKQIGYNKIKVRTAPPTVKKESTEIYCDLSGIAKGFGVDKIAEYLNSISINNYLVEIGGEIRTGRKNISDKEWTIGISTPDGKFDIQKVISLSNVSVATSGDYRNYFEEGGVRYSHTIDPRNGKPITHNLASVSVIHKSCMMADGIATAINVLGSEAGFEYAIKEKLPVLMVVKENDEFVEKMTPEFEKYYNIESK